MHSLPNICIITREVELSENPGESIAFSEKKSGESWPTSSRLPSTGVNGAHEPFRPRWSTYFNQTTKLLRNQILVSLIILGTKRGSDCQRVKYLSVKKVLSNRASNTM